MEAGKETPRLKRARYEQKTARREWEVKVEELKKIGISFFPRFPSKASHKWLDKDFIFTGEFGRLGAAREIFWPLIVHWNLQNKLFFPTLERISLLTGVSTQTVRKGIEILEDLGTYSFEVLVAEGKRNHKYRMELPFKKPEIKGQNTCFKLWDYPILSGFYRGLTKIEKIALMGVKCYSQVGGFNTDLYRFLEDESIEKEYGIGNNELEGPEIHDFWHQIYPNRKYDFISFGRGSNISKKQIAENIGLSASNFTKAFNGLIDKGAVEEVDAGWYLCDGIERPIYDKTYKIFTTIKDASYLRSQVMILDEVYDKKVCSTQKPYFGRIC